MSSIGSPRTGVRAAVATLVLGLALGACGSTEPTPVGSSPTPSAPPTTSPAASPSATSGGDVRLWVFFSRDQLPPVGAYVRGTFDEASAEKRIDSRIRALHGAGSGGVPAGAVNTVARLGKSGQFDMTVRVQGDLATLEFGPGQFSEIQGSAMIGSVIEQLVYTGSEEPSIRRVLLAERGKSELEIGGHAVIKDPRTREQVFVYASFGLKTEERVALEDDPRPATATTRIEEIAGGVRFVIEVKANETPAEGFWSPRVSAQLGPNEGNCLGKSKLVIELPGANDPAGPAGSCLDAGSPLRGLGLSRGAGPTPVMRYELFLDDARPWRVSLEPAAERGTMRLIVDVGGHPQAISDSVAVYGPKSGDQVTRTFTLTGAARAFEAHVAWRIKDSTQKEVATGFVTASLGTSPVWGTFTTEVKIPENVSGAVTLEVFWPSPRDGADVGKVAIPLRIR